MEGMIKLPADIDLKKFIQKTYEMSSPHGMGFFHAKDGGLTDAEAENIIARNGAEGRIAASMDYVHGRACKMTVFREEGELFVRPTWYDHSFGQYQRLLAEFGVTLPEQDDKPDGWGTAA